MKTAMQELIEYLDPIHSAIKDKALELLEKEKEQIKEAVCYDAFMDDIKSDGETYYNRIYNKYL
jgi:hypothetical protein